MSGKRKPWDRQDGESSAAFESFIAYRDLGLKRTLSQAAEVVGKTRGGLCKLSTEWGWVERCAAYDRKADQHRTRAHLSEIEKMHARHIRLATRLQDVAGLELERLERRIRKKLKLRAGDDKGDVTGANDISKTTVRAVGIERLARGEATERVETTVDLSALSVEELKELKRLRAKITEGKNDG